MSSMPSSPLAEFRRRVQQDAETRAPKANKHIMMYDNCSMHLSTGRTSGANLPSRSKAQRAAIRDDDIPPLEQLDDDDDEDARAFTRYQKESSSWLLFSGVLALLTTLFITNFTHNPLVPRNSARNMLPQLQQLQYQLHQLLEEMVHQGHNVSRLDFDFALERHTFATDVRDVWVPALCYSSLIISLFGAMVCLQIKHWLMSCSMAFFPLSPPHPDPPALRAAVQRLLEYRKSRAATVARTRRVVCAVPLLMYGAAAMFACGVAAKIGSFFWIAAVQ